MIKQLRKLLGISFYDLHEQKEDFPTFEEYCKFQYANPCQYTRSLYNIENRKITRHWTLKNPFNDKKIVIRKQKIQ